METLDEQRNVRVNTILPPVWPIGPANRGETYTAPFGAPSFCPLTHSLSLWDYAMGYTCTASSRSSGQTIDDFAQDYVLKPPYYKRDQNYLSLTKPKSTAFINKFYNIH